MFYIKLGILVIGFIQAGLLSYFVQKALRHISLDLDKQTLSFLSNKDLLFSTAIFTYLFF